MVAPLYELSQVTKQYAERTVLSIKGLAIYPNESLAIVGPSGAGKSTLLRLLNFLEAPTSGTIQFQNHLFSATETIPLAMRRAVTTVFQRPILLQRTVRANVELGLQLRQARNPAAVDAALDAVGLRHLAEQPARTLSGGEAQRVALARAMVIAPAVLLLDEPTANLDPYHVRLIEETILRLKAEHSCTVVIVTHNLFQARRLADRAALLLEGQLVEVAPIHTFFETPTDPRTAAFVCGEMVY